jgi:dTDP-4-dehydrorhamnose 3,5-epimerase
VNGAVASSLPFPEYGYFEMLFRPLLVSGAVLIEIEPNADDRGSFSRLFSRQEFEEHGLMSIFTQESIARNRRAGTLRGFHFQAPQGVEAKLVSCVRGSAFDVILDIRADSPTFGEYCTVTLRGGDWSSVYVPPGCAHAVQTLEDRTDLLYRISCDYDPSAARGYRWDSPDIAVTWPFPDPILSERDRSLPIFRKQAVSRY